MMNRFNLVLYLHINTDQRTQTKAEMNLLVFRIGHLVFRIGHFVYRRVISPFRI